MLWHQRRGHPCSKLLQSVLASIPSNVKVSINDDICSQCKYYISSKMHKLPFPKYVMSSTFPLQLVHSDVWGPALMTSVPSYRFCHFC